MTENSDLQPVVAAQYKALAAALATVFEGAWETASLCEGWRVREVIAHLTMPARYDEEAFMAELRDRKFDFGKLSNDIAARDGQLLPDRLLADLRSEQLHRWAPFGGDYLRALNHVVIHGLDATVPLRLERTASDEATIEVLDQMTGGGGHEHFGIEITGRRFEATDLKWSWGEGETLCGTASDLVLALAGRTVSEEQL